ncbi:MAG: hypothetical protein K2M36_05745 [Clostridia bacterium]|nr:hypothetical protein [Clostridia bacterium]
MKTRYGSTILDNAYDKYFKHTKITYEEYVIMLSTNDEIYFCYKDIEYQVVYESSEIVTMCISEYCNNKVVNQRTEYFSSIIELLNKFKIDGKLIREIWDDVSFD